MKYINEDGRLHIKSWCNEPEGGAIEQARNLASLPFAFHHIALMPDTHQGYGMPIGGVLATTDVVVPNAVGVDIGCGMCFVETDVPCSEVDNDKLRQILRNIRQRIPVGFNRHVNPPHTMPTDLNIAYCRVVQQHYDVAWHSLGTLGGGNHFIELQRNECSNLCVMIHSGSRNLGKQVADHYNKIAVGINRSHYSSVPKAWDLAFLPDDGYSEACRLYIIEMMYCLKYAKENRTCMLDVIQGVLVDAMGQSIAFQDTIDIHHNYVELENHFGQNVWVHRKGATRAREGELGIIPGSQGTASYIVRGKGNPDSFHSCSHGAGRKMGRKEARRNLDLEAEKRRLDDKGIVHAIRGTDDLDEAAGAYKDIEVVMQEQGDLVDIVMRLEPIAVIKG